MVTTSCFTEENTVKTDWNMIKEMMNAAIDACEKIEKTGYAAGDRDATINIGGQDVSVHDMLVSAWTYPENLRYQIIHERHYTDADLTYVPETARILLAMSQAASELVNAGNKAPAQKQLHEMIAWFNSHLAPSVENAISVRRGETTTASSL